jgi:predicted nucleic acid-binding protein
VSGVAGYLLDTTVLIDVSRNHQPTRSKVQALLSSGEDLGVSPVSIAEFYSGLREGERTAAEAFFQSIRTWDLDHSIAVRAGDLRRALSRQGRTVALPDALIAATALVVDAVVLTSNVRHFSLPGLKVLPMEGG